MDLRIEVDTVEVLDTIAGIYERAGRPDWMLERMADRVLDHAADAFSSRGFGRWARNDPAWAAAKSSGRVLVHTGALEKSLTQARHPLGVRRSSGESMLVGTKHVAAPYLKAGARGMPKRDPLPAPPPKFTQRVAVALLGELVTGRTEA